MPKSLPLPEKLPNRFGMHVTGNDYWPRPGVAEAAESLLRGDSLSLFGLRRTGKSSYMAAVRRHVQAGSTACVADIDAQRCDGLHALFNALLTTLPDKSVKERLLARLP